MVGSTGATGTDEFGEELFDVEFGGDGLFECVDGLFAVEFGGGWHIVSTLKCNCSLLLLVGRCLSCCGFGVDARTGCGV